MDLRWDQLAEQLVEDLRISDSGSLYVCVVL